MNLHMNESAMLKVLQECKILHSVPITPEDCLKECDVTMMLLDNDRVKLTITYYFRDSDNCRKKLGEFVEYRTFQIGDSVTVQELYSKVKLTSM